MDQAGTLRHLLCQPKHIIEPLLGDEGCAFVRPLCQALFEHHERAERASLIFDGGFLVENPSPTRDFLKVLQNKASFEDLARPLLPSQYLIQANDAFLQLNGKQNARSVVEQRMHRLPVTCEYLYATLPKRAWKLAAQFAQASRCHWLVSPTSVSVTQTYQSIGQVHKSSMRVQQGVVVVGVDGADQADEVFASLQEAVSDRWPCTLQYYGYVPKLKKKTDSVRVRQACGRVVSVMSRTAQAEFI